MNRFIVRDFTFEDSALEKQRKELSELEAEEKELWVSSAAPTHGTRANPSVRATQINENQLLGGLPDPSPPQDCSTVYRECAPIRSSSRIRRCHHQGKSSLWPIWSISDNLARDKDCCVHPQNPVLSLLLPLSRIAGTIIKEEQEVWRDYRQQRGCRWRMAKCNGSRVL
jgi:hypothetical protein